MSFTNPTELMQPMEKLLNLSIDPDWYASITNHFIALEKVAVQIMQLDLPQHTESAMVYQLPDTLTHK